MLAKFSVKKPYYVFVAVVIILILGVVSVATMKTDLLPEIQTPYLAVITTDVGASPEQVEEEVTDKLEGPLGTISGVKTVNSSSYENYSTIFLEFNDGTDMDGALVKVSAAVNQVQPQLPDSAGTPTYMEMNMDMIATMYLAISSDDNDISKLTQKVDDDIIPALQRQDGVANVTASGQVTDQIEVQLNQDKIDNVNDGIMGKTNDSLAKAKSKLDAAGRQLDTAEKKLDAQQKQLDKAKKQANDGFAKASEATNQLLARKSTLEAQKATMQAQIATLQAQLTQAKSAQKAQEKAGKNAGKQDAGGKAASTAQRNAAAAAAAAAAANGADGGSQDAQAAAAAALAAQQGAGAANAQGAASQAAQQQAAGAQDASQQVATLEKQISQLQKTYKKLEDGSAQLDSGIDQASKGSGQQTSTTLSLAQAQSQLDSGKQQISQSRQQLKSSRQQYESQRSKAKKNANIDKLVDADTLSKLITAQDLEMPAGYVDGGNDRQWVVKMGQKFQNKKQLKDMVLTKVKGIGDITLGDVADVVSTSDAADQFSRLNGKDSITLAVTKASTANTGEVSDRVNAEVSQLQQDNPNLHIVAVMDQGKYIHLYINTILQSLVLGAILAVIVLAVFLKNIRPTLVVAFSIPFSVLFALVLMYFSGLTLNIMTLGALSIAIGMLVDNSIVVMENIYRLRARGLSATRAAAQGAAQVTAAVVASTLTSVCVFLPFVFSEGTVRELMIPFALTMSFALLASLLVALSVVPALGSKIFENTEPAEIKWFERLKDFYGKWLERALRHKAPTLLIAVGLLVASVVLVFQMGIVMLPNMTSTQFMVTAKVPDDMGKADAYSLAETIGDRVKNVDGVGEVAMADANAASNVVSGSNSLNGGSTFSGQFMVYVTLDPKVTTESQATDVKNQVLDSCKGLDVELTSQDSTSSMSSLAGGDATVEVRGNDENEVLKLSDEVVKAMKGIDGYEEVSNGQEDADKTLRLVMDKDKLARMGTSVAQVYQQVQGKLKDSTTAITIAGQDKSIDVNVSTKKLRKYTKKNILDMTFTDQQGKKHKLSSVAKAETQKGIYSITSENQTHMTRVTADVKDGYNVTLLARQLQPELDKIDVPAGYSIQVAGTNADIQDMLGQMAKLAILGFVLLYLVMMAQFQNWLSPFIIIFTVPLAFTGGLLALAIAGEQLSMLSLFGFVILMGTIVNNGIVFVDYANQLRLGGMAKRAALVVTGKTRMRPILMTALTTIISMGALIFSQDIGAGMQRGMALVVAGGLLYGTLMTLFVVPVIYDLFSRKPLVPIDVGDDTDEDANDAEAYIAELGDDARETYDYESRRERRRRKRREKREKGEKNE